MRWVVDLLYLIAAVVTAPLWLVRMIATGRIRTDWRGRVGGGAALPPATAPRILIHAVSVGELNAIRLLVDRLADHETRPGVVIATTTDTGFARANQLFSGRHTIVRYPFDFSFAVSRFLDRVQPDVVALVELEVWPNFTAACEAKSIPIGVINGRLTERSAKRYRLVRAFLRRTFARLAFIDVQNETYAARFRALGAPPGRIRITNTMKWDTAQIADDVPGADDLAHDMGIDRSRPLVVAGSTAPEEHNLIHDAVGPDVQLLCAPRRPEWFDQAAFDLPGCARRSAATRGSATNRFLLDTIGELRLAYALADLVIVGRSFGDLHGSDMIEPVALGKATIVGPAVSDFQQTVDALLAGDGLVQTNSQGLKKVVHDLLANPDRRRTLAANGRDVIRQQQGATDRHAERLIALLEQKRRSS